MNEGGQGVMLTRVEDGDGSVVGGQGVAEGSYAGGWWRWCGWCGWRGRSRGRRKAPVT